MSMTMAFFQNIGWMEMVCVLIMVLIVIGVIGGSFRLTTKQTVKQMQEHQHGGAGAVMGAKASNVEIERALDKLLAQTDSQGFVIIEVVGQQATGERPFVQFIHSGDVSKGLIVDLPTVNLDATQAKRAEEIFTAMQGWRAGQAHQAYAGRHAGTAAKLGRAVLTGVYGLNAGAELIMREG